MPELLGALTKSLLDPILIIVVLIIYYVTSALSNKAKYITAIVGAITMGLVGGWLSAVNTGTGAVINAQSAVFAFFAFIIIYLVVNALGRVFRRLSRK